MFPRNSASRLRLGGYQSINDLVMPTGRLMRQRDLAWKLLTDIPGVTAVKPKAAMYLFPRLDPKMYPIEDDQQFVLDLLTGRKGAGGAGQRIQLAVYRITSAWSFCPTAMTLPKR